MSIALAIGLGLACAQDPVDVEGQPLAANAARIVRALEFLGSPLPADAAKAIEAAGADAKKIQQILDPRTLLIVSLNPESRVKVARGPAEAVLQQGAFTPVLVKIVNDSTVKSVLRISSPQSGQVYAGGAAKGPGDTARFLQVEMYVAQPMTGNLSGLKAEYAIALIYSHEAGKREATIGFDVGQGKQDEGFRPEIPVLFDVRPGVQVKLAIRDFDGKPTAGRFTFRDASGRVYPSRVKRLAPDFFFQDQVYRHDGGIVILPPGELTMLYGRGPEYRVLERKVTIPAAAGHVIEVKLDRWVNAMDHGFFSGDHHIHAAGCAHYTSPTEGVHADDMFVHVKGEGLNVGCNLTWGPCYDYQRTFFEAGPHKLSEPFTVLKYDVEVSGFGSQALGHVCLLNLRDQTYPGSDGTKTKGWPTWTTPLMRWAKAQGAVTGYAHSASGLNIDPAAAAKRLVTSKDLLPEEFDVIDKDGNKTLTVEELQASVARVMNRLPNHVIPEMNGIGAQEICVTTAMGVCDFISAMDTARVPEWNCWYHIMNCGFPLKASGETDFPCISGSRVGEGRVYVQLGKVDRVDYTAWCEGIRSGRSYVSDGYAHALRFSVDGKPPGDVVNLERAGTATAMATVAFGSELPLGTARGGALPQGDDRLVELIVNGAVTASKRVPADDKPHDLKFEVKIDRSSWVALRQFPQMHTNPVNVIVGGKPIRASRKSALWCIGVIEQLWRVRRTAIAPHERDEAEKTFQKAIEQYRKIADECQD